MDIKFRTFGIIVFIGFVLLNSCNKTDSSTNNEGGNHIVEEKAFLNNSEMWDYLHKNQFVSVQDSTLITFEKYKAYTNGILATEELSVVDVTPSTASLTGLSTNGGKAYLIVVKDGCNDGIIDMSNPNQILQYKLK